LLFAVGALSAIGALHSGEAFLVLIAAAIAGDGANYWIGRRLAARVLSEGVWFVNRARLDHTYRFYERHGRKTIVLARFVPIVRTFAPFVAGMGRMNYGRFAISNVAGGTVWVSVCMGAGFVWGNQPWVKENFGLLIVGIVLISILPALVQLLFRRPADDLGSTLELQRLPVVRKREPKV
jgi:membrane-associated protein